MLDVPLKKRKRKEKKGSNRVSPAPYYPSALYLPVVVLAKIVLLLSHFTSPVLVHSIWYSSVGRACILVCGGRLVVNLSDLDVEPGRKLPETGFKNVRILLAVDYYVDNSNIKG